MVMTTGTFRVVSEKVFVNDIDSKKFPPALTPILFDGFVPDYP